MNTSKHHASISKLGLNYGSWIFKFFILQRKESHFKVLFSALLIAVTLITFVQFVTDAMRLNIEQKASELLGADLVIEGATPIPSNILTNISPNIESTKVVSFLTMLENGNNLRLVSAKAIEDNYPVKGQVLLKDNSSNLVRKAPQSGTLWLDENILADLNIKLGDKVTLGAMIFTVTHTIESEPDRGGDFIAIAPHIILSMSDLEKTKVIQPGSKITYKAMFGAKSIVAKGGESVAELERWLEKHTQELKGFEFYTPKTGKKNFRSSLDKVQDYIQLGTLLNILLAGIAIAIASLEYIKSRYHDIAILRSMGASLNAIILSFGIGLLRIAIITIPIGLFLGAFLGFSVVNWLGYWTSFDIYPLVLGATVGFAMLILFALPPIYLVRHVSTMSLIQNTPITLSSTQWFMIGFGALGFSTLLWLELDQSSLLFMTLSFIVLYVIFVSLILIVSLGLLGKLLSKLPVYFTGIAFKHGVLMASRRKTSHLLSTTAFSLGVGIFVLMQLLSNDLWNNWEETLPKSQPNFFGINLAFNELNKLESLFQEQKIIHSPFYPIVSGKLVEVNQQEGEGFYRPLNLTEARSLPPQNKVVQGEWPVVVDKINDKVVHAISVESGFASRMNLKLGDTLNFRAGDKELLGKITQLREVKWDNFLPNFFVIFPVGVFSQLDSRYLVSFYIDDENKALLKTLSAEYPSMTLFDVRQILKEVRGLIHSLENNINAMLVLTLGFSFLILYATLQATLVERSYEVALLKALGATRKVIMSIFTVEFGLLGMLAGLSGALFANGLVYVLCKTIFKIEFTFNIWALVLSPIAGGSVLIFFVLCY